MGDIAQYFGSCVQYNEKLLKCIPRLCLSPCLLVSLSILLLPHQIDFSIIPGWCYGEEQVCCHGNQGSDSHLSLDHSSFPALCSLACNYRKVLAPHHCPAGKEPYWPVAKNCVAYRLYRCMKFKDNHCFLHTNPYLISNCWIVKNLIYTCVMLSYRQKW